MAKMSLAALSLSAGLAAACPLDLFVGQCEHGLLASTGNADAMLVMNEWKREWPEEAPFLARHAQLTFADEFLKAGEAYFSPDARWIIFQAIPQPAEGEAPSEHYSMYVASLQRDAEGNATGLGEVIRVCEPGSANTCGWFHPTLPGVVLFGSTTVPPAGEERPGYSREGSRYTWAFPDEMEIVTRTVREIVEAEVRDPAQRAALLARPDVHRAVPLFQRDGYDAEGSWSPDGSSILYTAVNPETGDGDLWIYHVASGATLPVVEAAGYDGGPFFSPDGRFICYRSDRRGDNLLQLFVAELAYEDGVPVGIKGEYQLTDNEDVNWCPYWHPSGRYLVYATSEVGHHNYEVFAIPFDPENPGTRHEPVRVTQAEGFDGLPVFSPAGDLLMWTAQRGMDTAGEGGRRSSQLWIATVGGAHPFGGDDGGRSELTVRPVPGEQAAAPAGGMPTKFRFGIKPGNYVDAEPGVVAEFVSPGTSAYYAGLLAGDRLMTWNGTTIESVNHWVELLGAHKAGDVVKVGVRRNGQDLVLAVELVAQ